MARNTIADYLAKTLAAAGVESIWGVTGDSLNGLAFSLETPVDKRPATAGNGVHIAFNAPDRATVDRFHREALRLGGRDAGAPGL